MTVPAHGALSACGFFAAELYQGADAAVQVLLVQACFAHAGLEEQLVACSLIEEQLEAVEVYRDALLLCVGLVPDLFDLELAVGHRYLVLVERPR